MRKHLHFGALLQVAALALAGSTYAEPLPPGARARLLLTAHQALTDGRIAEARDAHLALWEATGEQEQACNAGRLSFRIRDMPKAVELLGHCLANAPGDDDTKDIRIELARARMLVAELLVRGPKGTEVLIDGARRGKVPLTTYVWPGFYVVTGQRSDDDEEGAVGVNAEAGEAHAVDLRLERPASRPNGWIIAGGALTSAGLLGLGTGLLLASNSLERKGYAKIADANGCAQLDRPGCREAVEAFDQLPMMRGVSTAAVIAGATLGAATLIYTFVPRSRVPVSTRVGAGFVAVEGRW